MIGAEMIRWSGRSKPQSSSSHRLKACTDAIVASMSCLSASSTPQANVGSMNTVSRFCLSRTFTRASRFWYSGWSARRSTFISDAGSTPSGISPRNSRSRQPGSMIGSKVGFGMKWLTTPPITAKVRLPSVSICTPRRLNSLGRCRVNESSRLVVVVVDVDRLVVQCHGRVLSGQRQVAGSSVCASRRTR